MVYCLAPYRLVSAQLSKMTANTTMSLTVSDKLRYLSERYDDDDEGFLPEVLEHVDAARELAIDLLRRMNEFDAGTRTPVPTVTKPKQPEATSAGPAETDVDALRARVAELEAALAESQGAQKVVVVTHEKGVQTETPSFKATHTQTIVDTPAPRPPTTSTPKVDPRTPVTKKETKPASSKKTGQKSPTRPNRFGADSPKMRTGWYRDKDKSLYIKVVGGQVVVRVGGGWTSLRQYLSSHMNMGGLSREQAHDRLDAAVKKFTKQCLDNGPSSKPTKAPFATSSFAQTPQKNANMASLPMTYHGNKPLFHDKQEMEQAFRKPRRTSLASHIVDAGMYRHSPPVGPRQSSCLSDVLDLAATSPMGSGNRSSGTRAFSFAKSSLSTHYEV